MSDASSGERDIETRVQIILREEDEILNLAENIKITLHENLRLAEEPSQGIVVYALKEVFSIEYDPETAEDLAYVFLNVVKDFRPEYITIFKNNDSSRELLEFFNEVASKHQLAIHQLRFRRTQGPYYWEEISENYVMRTEEDRPGIDYEIRLGRGKPMKLSVSLKSNLLLISHLLRSQYFAFDYFGEAGAIGVEEEYLDEIINTAEEIKKMCDQVADESTESG